MNRLKELRQRKNLTFKELSKKLQEDGIRISSDSLAKYERGDRHPKIDKWQALANFFNVSVPYLQGTDDKTVIKKISSEDLLQELIDRKVLTQIPVGLYKEFELKRKYKNRDKTVNCDGVLLLHNDN